MAKEQGERTGVTKQEPTGKGQGWCTGGHKTHTCNTFTRGGLILDVGLTFVSLKLVGLQRIVRWGAVGRRGAPCATLRVLQQARAGPRASCPE
jgi:hypothetical protein